jgi:hypothetical protein
MLDRDSQVFDMQEIWLAQQAVKINAQGMSSQFSVQTGVQSPESMGMVLFDIELLSKLTVDGFNDLTDGIMNFPGVGRQFFAGCFVEWFSNVSGFGATGRRLIQQRCTLCHPKHPSRSGCSEHGQPVQRRLLSSMLSLRPGGVQFKHQK